MLYEPNEIKTPEKQLEKIFKQLPSPICLLGGWAAYHIVNKSFEKANGRKYIGSRDIDIGFHIDKEWTQKQLAKSKFATAIRIIEKASVAIGIKAQEISRVLAELKRF
ncbi:MAG: hypothetical protein HXX80_06635 [Nitrososphaerales archaeon]|nr:hypothetical protein [Nitrososphaerales archaeon]